MEEIVLNREYASLVVSSEDIPDDETFTPFRRKRLVPTADFYQRLGSKSNLELGTFLPQNTRFVQQVGVDSALVIIEEEPRLRNVTVDMDLEGTIEKFKITGKLEEYGYDEWLKHNRKPYRMQLAFPYIIYIILLTKGGVSCAKPYYRLQPIVCMEDYLLRPNLPNIGGDGSLCLGDFENKTPKRGIFDQASGVIERFWVNSFNKDLSERYESYSKVPEVSDFLTWQYNSMKDPMFIYGVKWKKEDYTLGGAVEHTLKHYAVSGMGNSMFCFDSLKGVFTNRRKIRENSRLLINVTESTALDGGAVLAVGDEVTYKKKNHYVKTFIGNRFESPTSVVLEPEEGGEDVEVELTPSRQKSFSKQMLGDKLLKSVEINGLTVAVGDIIILTYPENSYRKITKLRKARDGKIEAQCNRADYYLLENLKFKIFDENKVTIGDVEVGKNDEVYLLSRSSGRRERPFCYGNKAVFVGFDDKRGTLVAKFQDVDTGHSDTHRVSLTGDSHTIAPVKDMFVPPAYRIFCKLHSNLKTDKPQYPLIRGKGIMVPSGGVSNRRYDSEVVKKSILSEDRKEINIPSFDIDINFKVGDEVVVADWDDPVEMLKIRTIKQFLVSDNKITVKTVDGQGNERRDEYIDFADGFIWTGKIRHIMREFAGIKSGDKIRAKTAGIYMFPKKDVNTVIGFLPDCGEGHYPLMLCSNLCTQWASPSSLVNFDVYKITDPKWHKLKNAPIQLSKLKPQCGDTYIQDRDHKRIFVAIYRRYHYNKLALTNVVNRWGYGYSNNMEPYYMDSMKRFGFLSPRYTLARIDMMRGYKKWGFSNLQNGFTEHSSAEFNYREDWDYVQCLD